MAAILRAELIGSLFAGGGKPGSPFPEQAFGEWQLEDAIRRAEGEGAGDAHTGNSALVKCLLNSPGPFPSAVFFESPAARACLNLNEHDGVVYFHKESLEFLVRLVLLRDAFRRTASPEYSRADRTGSFAGPTETAGLLDRAAAGSGYRLDRFLLYLESDEFLTLTRGPAPAPPPP
jgi:hypothetical protein